MNDSELVEYADLVDEHIIEKYLCYENKLHTQNKFFRSWMMKSATAVCACMIIAFMVLGVMANNGYIVRVDFSEMLNYQKIEYITISGGPLDSSFITLNEKSDIERFCEMFVGERDLYLVEQRKITDEEPENKDSLEIFTGCLVVISYETSEDDIMIVVNTDNTFILQKGDKTYICKKTDVLNYNKIKYFR